MLAYIDEGGNKLVAVVGVVTLEEEVDENDVEDDNWLVNVGDFKVFSHWLVKGTRVSPLYTDWIVGLMGGMPPLLTIFFSFDLLFWNQILT